MNAGSPMEIRFVDATEAESYREALVELLRDAVDGGASVGFLPPLEESEARAYWEGVREDLVAGRRSLALAWVEGRVAGTAQLVEAGKANARHRAEVSRVLVHSAFRRRGLGAALMRAVEARAREQGKRTLVLDTREGDSAERLYQSLGWIRVGVIPEYARNGAGTLDGTAVYYKLLGADFRSAR
ncbi:GNAT family N-acetyltransferase [Hyalangium rubrum]|uniref:GNAT family N-acetyltransferase n=1 Tax=Hyalangium rubrum TaxID=3103134 RepID=A0ABU5H3V4_9BACT|nr:GNAT family N-acetyltransferase [Hyalangium sp. s54d21]MDY7228143.1 GNAT family N-acetyltransferase [Hyalangium sp. s54d21]